MSLERIPFSLRLCQAHGGEERNHREFGSPLRTKEPSPVLLEYTFTRQSVALKNSIQAGLGSVRLKPTVKEANEVVTYLCNLIAVKVYPGNAIALLILYAGVVTLPINFGGDGSVHLAFDFAHGLLRLVDLLSMAPREGVWGDWWTVPQPSHDLFAKLAAEVECHSFVVKGATCKGQRNIITFLSFRSFGANL